jgi:hypothetical protein
LCFGIAAGVVVWLAYWLCTNPESLPPEKLVSNLSGPLEIIAVIALPIWMLILLPLYTLLPRSSALWRTGICTTLGTLAGALLAFLAMFIPGGFETVAALWICLWTGAVVGAVTCWFGAATANYFHKTSPS